MQGYAAELVPSWTALDLEFSGQAAVPGFCAAAAVAPPPGFEISSIIVRSAQGEVVGASPVFRTTYRLDTSLPLALRRPVGWIERLFPRMVTVPLLGIGSPVMDRCSVGFQAGASVADRVRTFSTMVEALEGAAHSSGVGLVAVKDFGDGEAGWSAEVLRSRGYSKMASLPVAALDLPFANVDEYLASLSASVRQDLRRKVRKSAASVRFTECSGVTGIEAELAHLYEETRTNAKGDYGNFDALSPRYVEHVLDTARDGARVLLGWVGDTLASYSLMLVGPDCAYAHQIGMRYPLARENNLYFLNWLAAVRFCIERGIRRLEFGQTSYPLKVRLGCRLEPSWIYFRHRLRPVNAALGYAAPMFGFDRMEQGSA